jgi:protein ImuA
MLHNTLSMLRHSMKGLAEGCCPDASDLITFGASTIDDALGGGLVRGRLHDIYADTTAHIGAATGFAAALALRAAKGKSLLWVWQEFLENETGRLNASGLAELGLDPGRIILVRARDAEGVLRAGEQAARCAALGAVVVEPWGEPKMLDFTASRRLSLAATKSGTSILMLRAAASPAQSAAATRWRVQALPSRALAANAPGFPAFELNLLRHRGGIAGHVWRVEWDRDRKCFQDRQRTDAAPVSRPVVSVSHDGSAAAGARPYEFRKAG